MNREKAKRCVEYVIDDAGDGCEWGEFEWAIVREKGYNKQGKTEHYYEYPSKLVVWEKAHHSNSSLYYLVVAVHSYLDVQLTNDEAEDLARDYLCEIGYFKEGDFPADFIF